MQIRWTAAAADDLERVADFLFESSPQNAPSLIRRAYEAASSLAIFPNRGRPGKMGGTRELLVPSLPYIVVYEVSGETIHILRIPHGAQQWPPP